MLRLPTNAQMPNGRKIEHLHTFFKYLKKKRLLKHPPREFHFLLLYICEIFESIIMINKKSFVLETSTTLLWTLEEPTGIWILRIFVKPYQQARVIKKKTLCCYITLMTILVNCTVCI